MATPSYIIKRQTQGAGQVLFGKGGLGFIARRGVDYGTSIALQSLDGVARLATSQPLELLSLLPDLVPEMGLALWNETNLACGPGRVRLKAMTTRADGTSEEAPDGTAAIKALWNSNPDEAGNLEDCHSQMYQMLKFSGLAVCEAVPGPRRSGLQAVFPVNSLTLRFKREPDGTMALYQRQSGNPDGLGVYSAGFSGYFVPLPNERMFYSRLPALPDEPYGRVPMSPALTIILEILAFWRNMMLAFTRVGTPKYDYAFDLEGAAAFAKDQLNLTDRDDIADYVTQEFNKFAARIQDMDADDAFVHGLKDKVGVVGSGGAWPDFPAIWSALRLRLIQAVKSLSVMVGVVDGDTETWSEIQWDLATSSIMLGILKSLTPLQKAAQLHLQLLGMPYTVEPEITPIRSIQRLADAQAAALELDNEVRKRDEGLQSQDTTAMKITGSAPVAPGPIRPTVRPTATPGNTTPPAKNNPPQKKTEDKTADGQDEADNEEDDNADDGA